MLPRRCLGKIRGVLLSSNKTNLVYFEISFLSNCCSGTYHHSLAVAAITVKDNELQSITFAIRQQNDPRRRGCDFSVAAMGSRVSGRRSRWTTGSSPRSPRRSGDGANVSWTAIRESKMCAAVCSGPREKKSQITRAPSSIILLQMTR